MNSVAFNYSFDKKLELNFKPITRALENWPQEINNTIKIIRKSTKKPLYLCMSGGIDSEVIALKLIENNIKFTALIVRFKNNYNYHDIMVAQEFCKKYHIDNHTVYLDMEEFCSNKIDRYIAEGYKAVRIFRYLQLFMLETIEHLGGCGIIGSGEQVYCNVDGVLCLNRDFGHMMSLEWCKNNNTLHYPYFFEQNPELFASYMKEELIDFLLQKPEYFINHIDNMSTEKILIYHKYWPTMDRRFKFHGFENILKLKSETEKKLRDLFLNIVPTFFPIYEIKKQIKI
jgi:hypothetical protein